MEEHLWGFIRPGYRCHLSAGICFCLSAGLRQARAGGGHRKYDGRMRRWDLSGVRTNERHGPEAPKVSYSARSRGMNDQETSGADRAPVRLRIDIPGCANKRNLPGERAARTSAIFQFFPFFAPFLVSMLLLYASPLFQGFLPRVSTITFLLRVPSLQRLRNLYYANDARRSRSRSIIPFDQLERDRSQGKTVVTSTWDFETSERINNNAMIESTRGEPAFFLS